MNDIIIRDNFNNIFKKQLKVEENIVISTFESPDLNKIGNLSNSIFYRTAGSGYWITFLNKVFETTSLSKNLLQSRFRQLNGQGVGEWGGGISNKKRNALLRKASDQRCYLW